MEFAHEHACSDLRYIGNGHRPLTLPTSALFLCKNYSIEINNGDLSQDTKSLRNENIV
jgi:hypothetical protein